MNYHTLHERKSLMTNKHYKKKKKLKSPSSVNSYMSNYNTSDSLDETCDDLVCTNCVQTDYYLAQFCEELFYSPSTATYHLERMIHNPEFPKEDLDTPVVDSISVPVTTWTCEDCNPLDEKEPPRQIRAPECAAANVAKGSPSSPCNYEKQRREVERQLINRIYGLVRDQKSSSSVTFDDSIHHHSSQSHRVTKLQVSEMAIQRMRNIQKINYVHQIERVKQKLLQSYRAFAKLDNYLYQLNTSKDVSKIVPYSQKIKELERSLHLKS